MHIQIMRSLGFLQDLLTALADAFAYILYISLVASDLILDVLENTLFAYTYGQANSSHYWLVDDSYRKVW